MFCDKTSKVVKNLYKMKNKTYMIIKKSYNLFLLSGT